MNKETSPREARVKSGMDAILVIRLSFMQEGGHECWSTTEVCGKHSNGELARFERKRVEGM